MHQIRSLQVLCTENSNPFGSAIVISRFPDITSGSYSICLLLTRLERGFLPSRIPVALRKLPTVQTLLNIYPSLLGHRPEHKLHPQRPIRSIHPTQDLPCSFSIPLFTLARATSNTFPKLRQLTFEINPGSFFFEMLICIVTVIPGTIYPAPSHPSH